ncbi:MAG TPA: hypothetical protein VIV60_12180 [Polyangiaceae bacterium]
MIPTATPHGGLLPRVGPELREHSPIALRLLGHLPEFVPRTLAFARTGHHRTELVTTDSHPSVLAASSPSRSSTAGENALLARDTHSTHRLATLF